MERGRLTWIALGLAGIALVAALAGFVASWYSVDLGGTTATYGYSGETLKANGATLDAPYSDARTDTSVRQTFQIQDVIVWLSVVFALASLGFLAAPYYGTPTWARPASFAALGALAAVALIGAGLFQHNMTIALASETGDPTLGFRGAQSGTSWGPGFAWYAEWAAGILGLGALVAAALPADATSVPVRASPPPATSDDPVEVLRLRFARGEITTEEFERAKRALEQR